MSMLCFTYPIFVLVFFMVESICDVTVFIFLEDLSLCSGAFFKFNGSFVCLSVLLMSSLAKDCG